MILTHSRFWIPYLLGKPFESCSMDQTLMYDFLCIAARIPVAEYVAFQIGSSSFGKSTGAVSAILIARPRGLDTIDEDRRLGDGKADTVNLELGPGSNMGDSWQMVSTLKSER